MSDPIPEPILELILGLIPESESALELDSKLPPKLGFRVASSIGISFEIGIGSEISPGISMTIHNCLQINLDSLRLSIQSEQLKTQTPILIKILEAILI